jgi:hypothetical protein
MVKTKIKKTFRFTMVISEEDRIKWKVFAEEHEQSIAEVIRTAMDRFMFGGNRSSSQIEVKKLRDLNRELIERNLQSIQDTYDSRIEQLAGMIEDKLGSQNPKSNPIQVEKRIKTMLKNGKYTLPDITSILGEKCSVLVTKMVATGKIQSERIVDMNYPKSKGQAFYFLEGE